MTPDRSHIGIAGPSDHPVFSRVVDRLVDRGVAVSWFDPSEPIPEASLQELSLFVAKRNRPASIRALCTATRLGVPTWNSPTSAMVCVHHVTQLCALAGVGFRVPPVSFEPPEGDHVAKPAHHWGGDPVVNGVGDVYEPLLDADPVDHKYYAVATGDEVAVRVVRATSKLHGDKEVVGRAGAIDEHVRAVERLLDLLGMRGVGVDLIRADDGWYAVDLNPCPSFGGAGMVDELVASLAAACQNPRD